MYPNLQNFLIQMQIPAFTFYGRYENEGPRPRLKAQSMTTAITLLILKSFNNILSTAEEVILHQRTAKDVTNGEWNEVAMFCFKALLRNQSEENEENYTQNPSEDTH